MKDRGCAIHRQHSAGALEIRVSGVIDEHADLSPLAALTENVVIDLGGVTRINSFGVRLWIDVFKRRELPVEVRLVRCPPVVIDQANLIPRFFGGARIVSFYVPIRCEPCRTEARYLARPEDVVDFRGLRFHAPCERCNRPMEVDEWEEHYFQFLKDQV